MTDYIMGQEPGQGVPIEGHQLNLKDDGKGLVNVPKAAKKKKKVNDDGYAKPERWPNRQFRRQYVTMPKGLPFMASTFIQDGKSVTKPDPENTWIGKVRDNIAKGIRFNNAFFQNQDRIQTEFKNSKSDSMRKHFLEFYKGDKAKVEAVMSDNERIEMLRYEKKLSNFPSNVTVKVPKRLRKNAKS